MQQAELIGFIRTILILVLGYYILKFLMRILAPIVLKKVAHNIQRKSQEQPYQYTTKVKEGETVIDKKPNTQKESNSSVGEYIDFEELDE
ncbi:MAG: DUF4834 family protein [Flavobacteriaceae bacterium]|nr:MAG: DUF4834 family protein [Flavobacteriaceae bacterium]